jgi:hypothetical protein
MGLLIGYSSRVRTVDMVIVHEACTDLEGSQQGFHYYRFLREEQKRQQGTGAGGPAAAQQP